MNPLPAITSTKHFLQLRIRLAGGQVEFCTTKLFQLCNNLGMSWVSHTPIVISKHLSWVEVRTGPLEVNFVWYTCWINFWKLKKGWKNGQLWTTSQNQWIITWHSVKIYGNLVVFCNCDMSNWANHGETTISILSWKYAKKKSNYSG